eukprot:2169381-Rhodomonas_salina.2
MRSPCLAYGRPAVAGMSVVGASWSPTQTEGRVGSVRAERDLGWTLAIDAAGTPRQERGVWLPVLSVLVHDDLQHVPGAVRSGIPCLNGHGFEEAVCVAAIVVDVSAVIALLGSIEQTITTPPDDLANEKRNGNQSAIVHSATPQ